MCVHTSNKDNPYFEEGGEKIWQLYVKVACFDE